jgi:hypothetical protein
MNRRRPPAVATLGILAAVVLAACGSSSKAGSPSSAPSSDNTFVLSEFTIVPPTNTLHAGSVSITADNVGGEVHELVIVRAPSAAALPMKPDGSVDEDTITAADKVGEIEEISARSHQAKTFDLTSGTYVAFCNIADTMMGSDTTMNGMGSGTGHIHFAKGMHVSFTVQ